MMMEQCLPMFLLKMALSSKLENKLYLYEIIFFIPIDKLALTLLYLMEQKQLMVQANS